jgi:hypothetical protein
MNRYARNTTESLLLRLPGEIRNQIYEQVFGQRTYGFWVHSFKATYTQPNDLALLGVCRKIYAEARLFPFSLNTFCFPHFLKSYHTLMMGLEATERQVIRTVRITFYIREAETLVADLHECRLDSLSQVFPALRSVHLHIGGGKIDPTRLGQAAMCIGEWVRSGLNEGVDLEITRAKY